MSELNLTQMQQLQRELQEKYKSKWGGLSPEKARQKLLWLYGELGEVGDIIKKNGDEGIMNDADIRRCFTEELCDVLMYFNDVMLCYGISPEEFSEIYKEKHFRNMNRW